jgi:hypothetical protein
MNLKIISGKMFFFFSTCQDIDLKNLTFCGRIFDTKQLYKILKACFGQGSSSMSSSNARS